MLQASLLLLWWRRQGIWVRRGLVTVAGVLLWWLVTALVVPPVLLWQLEKQATAVLGRSVTAERVRFKPWSLELEVWGLRVAAAPSEPVSEPVSEITSATTASAGSESAPAQLAFERLYLNAELQSLLRWAPVLDAVRLEGPVLRLRHLGEGRYDVDDVLDRLRQRPSDPDAAPARFALYNLSLSDGQVLLRDDAASADHTVQGLELAIPFLSNLGSKREVTTEPRLAFVLNGSAFDSSAESTPFAESRATEARLRLQDVDLGDYLPYWPQRWPMRLAGGRLQADLGVDFSQTQGMPSVRLDGEVTLSHVRVDEVLPDGRTTEWLTWHRLHVVIADARPLESVLALRGIEWQGPSVWLRRHDNGQTNVGRMLSRWSAGHAVQGAAPTQPVAPAWSVRLESLAVSDGRTHWQDDTLQPAWQTQVEDVSVQVGPLAYPFEAPAPLQMRARHGEATVSGEGQFTDQMARVDLSLQGVALESAAPYLRQWLEPSVSGQLQARLGLQWAADGFIEGHTEGQNAGQNAERNIRSEGPGLRVTIPELELRELVLGSRASPQALLRQLRLSDAAVDVSMQRVDLGQVRLNRLWVATERDREGRWMVQRWLRAAAHAAPDGGSVSTPAVAGRPWTLAWSSVELQASAVRFRDQAQAKPVALDLSGWRLALGPWRSDAPGRTAVSLDARLALGEANRADPGRLSLQGHLGWTPAQPMPLLQLQAQLDASALPLHGLEPYVSEFLNLELLRADAGYRGRLALTQRPDGWQVALRGDLALDEWRANTLSPSEELLAWKALSVRGLELDLSPGTPLRLSVAETALSDWYARIAIDETGRINLQDLIRPAQGDAPTPEPVAGAGAGAAAAAQLRFGPVSLVNGRVGFSDRFIQPNYSAQLSELTGRLSAFSNQPAAPGGAVELAELELLGRVEGTAALDLRGRINPLAQPLALDLQGRVRELELPPLSPYSVKYAGHGIQRGKLSVNVAYRIEPDGRLNANNQIVLNQLAFGEREPGSEAPNLPVRLAVALLADRNGVIDINLPVSGSMNDPQFRLGPIIVRLIFNLIGKAVTAPFALLASALGGAGDESGQIAFAAGSARLDATARERLDTVAKALTDRPSLRLTVVGHADLETERLGYQRERVAELVLAEKRRRLTLSGASAQGDVTVTEAEYPALLKEVYRRADMPKPRNLIGMAKDLPVAEMETLLRANVPVNADRMRELALQRSVAVRDYLASRQLPSERLFVGAPGAVAGTQGAGAGPQPGGNASASADAGTASSPPPPARAELQLSAR